MNTNREALNLAGAFVAVALVSILAFVTWALVFREVPSANESSLSILLGLLGAQISAVVGFFFGSSIGAKKQAETIDTLAKTAQTAGVALGTPTDAMVIPPGQSATATATDAGTVIEKAE